MRTAVRSTFSLAVALAAVAVPAVANADTGAEVESAAWEQTEFPGRYAGVSAIDLVADATAAVGFRITETAGFKPLAATWDGEAWQKRHIRIAEAGEVQLTDLDLRTATRGWTVGSGLVEGSAVSVAAKWNGSRWREWSTSRLDLDTGLAGVAVVARDDVWAVGQKQVGSNLNAYIAHYDGDVWSPVKVPRIEGAGDASALSSVSVERPNRVWAVGYNGVSLRYNGTRWTQVEVPKIDGLRVQLQKVQSFGRDDTWAVGLVLDGSIRRPAALHWDGDAWQVVQVPASDIGQLNDVARTDTGVVAVGYSQDGPQHFYGLRLDPTGPAKSLALPSGEDALFGAATDPNGSELWVVGSGSLGDGKLAPFAAVRR